MGWFSKKENKKEGIPQLPELPKLPELSGLEGENIENKTEIHQLPSFPSNSFGTKFSQNAIKEAVAGGKEGENVLETKGAKEMFPRHLKKQFTKEIPFGRIPREFQEATRVAKKSEPIFIRIDKFEEGLKIFEDTKTKISDIEKILNEIKRTKEEEEIELSSWEKEIRRIKEQIEKVDKEIFSKIE